MDFYQENVTYHHVQDLFQIQYTPVFKLMEGQTFQV